MSMLLKSDDGNEFELALIEDRFPELQDDAADSNYITLSYRVATPDESWEETAPTINLFELKNLEEWLRAVAEGAPEVTEIELLEPELRFSVAADAGDQVTLRVGFQLDEIGDDLSTAPSEPGAGRPVDAAETDELTSLDAPTPEAQWVEIRLSRDKLAAAAAELERDLRAASTVHPPTQAAAEADSGVAGIPDEAFGLLDEDNPAVDETDDDRRF